MGFFFLKYTLLEITFPEDRTSEMSESPHDAAAFPPCHLPLKLILIVQTTSFVKWREETLGWTPHGDTSAVIGSFRQLDVGVGVHGPHKQQGVNVLCISELHYCKSIVGVLHACVFY